MAYMSALPGEAGGGAEGEAPRVRRRNISHIALATLSQSVSGSASTFFGRCNWSQSSITSINSQQSRGSKESKESKGSKESDKSTSSLRARRASTLVEELEAAVMDDDDEAEFLLSMY